MLGVIQKCHPSDVIGLNKKQPNEPRLSLAYEVSKTRLHWNQRGPDYRSLCVRSVKKPASLESPRFICFPFVRGGTYFPPILFEVTYDLFKTLFKTLF